ncbi:MAG: hypothetical protein KDA62_19920 [Planctomycetales bacterium]|nr:hypothetical protein [Planctomycetales bacterium]
MVFVDGRRGVCGATGAAGPRAARESGARPVGSAGGWGVDFAGGGLGELAPRDSDDVDEPDGLGGAGSS